jgi:ankyrin repeat protein
MSENMGPRLEEALRGNPRWATEVDAEGWTMLQREALAGNATPVSLLLRHGAERPARNARGETALELALAAGWPRVVRLLAH